MAVKPFPNIIAQKYIKPQKVILLYSEASAKQKENYKSVFPNMNFEDQKIDAFNFNDISTSIKNIIADNNDAKLFFNITGGTKIMSIAAFDIAKTMKLSSLYIDSENNKIYVFGNGSETEEDLNIKITSEEYLKSNGHVYKIIEPRLPEDSRIQYYEYLENNYSLDISRFLTKINEKFNVLKNKFYKDSSPLMENNFKYIWDESKRTSIINLYGNQFFINGRDSIKYICGLWFEDLVYYKKFYGNNNYDEIIRNIHIQDKGGKQDMIELDIIGLRKNNLYLLNLKVVNQ